MYSSGTHGLRILLMSARGNVSALEHRKLLRVPIFKSCLFCPSRIWTLPFPKQRSYLTELISEFKSWSAFEVQSPD